METPLTGKTKSGRVLTEQEELFCQHYVQNFSRIDAALASYNIDREKKHWRSTASNIANENLLKPYINERIRELLDEYHVNPESIDNETAFLMRQNADLSAKKGGIDIFNRVLGRYEKDNEQKKQEVNIYNWDNYEGGNPLSAENVDKESTRE